MIFDLENWTGRRGRDFGPPPPHRGGGYPNGHAEPGPPPGRRGEGRRGGRDEGPPGVS